MIRCDTGTDETPRCGKAIEEIDLDGWIRGEEVAGGVEPGWTGADDGDSRSPRAHAGTVPNAARLGGAEHGANCRGRVVRVQFVAVFA
jgi:hypothetical protein